MTQSTKKETKGVKSFKRIKKVRPRKFLARLVIADAEDEPNLSRAYLAELLENPGEYVEYWEDSLCCSADARILYEEYDPTQDEVALPYTLDPSDDMSVDSNHKYESAYAQEDYDLNPYEDNYYASYNVNLKKESTTNNMMSRAHNPMKQTISL